MTASRARRVLLLALVLPLVPSTLDAQQKAGRPVAPPAAAAQPQAEMERWLTELQQLHEKLETLQTKALQDAQLTAQQKVLGATIKAAMEKIDPAVAKGLDRLEELEAQAAEAQKTGNQARLQQLGQEAQQIERQFLAARQKALQQPDLAAELLEFQERLQKKMLEVDPDAQKMLTRFQELEAKLASAVRAAGR